MKLICAIFLVIIWGNTLYGGKAKELFEAIMREKATVVEDILDEDPELVHTIIISQRKTMLHLALNPCCFNIRDLSNRLHIVECLIRAGACNEVYNERGETPLESLENHEDFYGKIVLLIHTYRLILEQRY